MDSKTLATIIILALAISITYNSVGQAQESEINFENFKAKHGKKYGSLEEESYRFAVYTVNMQMINEHNANPNKGHIKGENDFADLTLEEFNQKYTGYIPSDQEEEVSEFEGEEPEFVGSVDWVTSGHVQKVKDQGQCGSCWAFSAVAALESAESIFAGNLQLLSEQQANDCATPYGSNGCSGGYPGAAFNYFKDNGICTESGYPYVARDQTCKGSSCSKISFRIKGASNAGGSASVVKANNDKQPLSICHQTGGWQYYASGILKDSECTSGGGHCTLLAGYTDSYWLVKNSWGQNWGESGYIRLEAPNNTCGFLSKAFAPYN